MAKTLDPIKGEDFVLTVTSSPVVRISSTLVKEMFAHDAKMLKALSTESVTVTMKTPRVNGKKANFVMPNLANATPGGLVDMLGKVREEMKDLKKLEGIYKEAIAARADIELPKKADGDGNEE